MEKLADKIVALGIGKHCGKGFYLLPESWDYSAVEGNECMAELFVRDWQVTGALMEKVKQISVEAWCKLLKRLMHEFDSRELPRAINEACCEVLEGT